MSGDDMKVLDTLGKSKKAIGGIIAILLCIVAIFFAGMKFADGKENDKITSTTIRNQLTEINELAVYSYDYSKVGKFSNKLSFNGWDIPLTQKNFIVTYDGTIKAGINLDEAKVDSNSRMQDDLLRAYLRFTGGNYSSLVNMAVNKEKVIKLRTQAQQAATRKTLVLNSGNKSNKHVDNNDLVLS